MCKVWKRFEMNDSKSNVSDRKYVSALQDWRVDAASWNNALKLRSFFRTEIREGKFRQKCSPIGAFAFFTIRRALKNCFCSSIVHFVLSGNLGATSLIFLIFGGGGWICKAERRKKTHRMKANLLVRKSFELGLRSRFGRLVISLVREAIESSTMLWFVVVGRNSVLFSSIVSFMTSSLIYDEKKVEDRREKYILLSDDLVPSRKQTLNRGMNTERKWTIVDGEKKQEEKEGNRSSVKMLYSRLLIVSSSQNRAQPFVVFLRAR